MNEETESKRPKPCQGLIYPGRGTAVTLGHPHPLSQLFYYTSGGPTAEGQEGPHPNHITNSDTSGGKKQTPHRKTGKGPE